MRLNNLIAAFASLLLLNACAVATKSVQIESYSIQGKNLSTIDRVVGEEIRYSLFKQLSGRKFALIKIHTDTDLLALSEKWTSTAFIKTWFCSKPDEEVFLGRGLYLSGESVLFWPIEFHLTGKWDEKVDRPNFEYDLVLFQEWSTDVEIADAFANNKSQTHYVKYDLKNNPLDVCISLEGGSMSFAIKSNTLVIPAAELRKVFK